MAQEQILMPNAPLFLVDRSWMKPGNKAKKAWTGNFRPQSLYGVAMKPQPYSANSRRQPRATRKQDSKLRGKEVKSRVSAGSQVKSQQEASREGSSEEREQHDHPIFKLDGSSRTILHPAFQDLDDFHSISGLETYLNYYSDIIATVVFPIEHYVRTRPNPIREFWFPLALTDSLLLKTFIVVSVIHRSVRDNAPQPESLKSILRDLLSSLNHRISKNELSEATIGAVSCIATVENNLGNFSAASIHLAGMSEMVRLNQWLSSSMTGEQRMKVWKADLSHSMDVLRPPNLPRPRPDPIYIVKNPPARAVSPGDDAVFFTTYINSAGLVSVAQELRKFSHGINVAWTNNIELCSETLYEDISCIQHDLLTYKALNEADEIVRLALIVFSKLFVRFRAYIGEASSVISQRMQATLQLLPSGLFHPDQELWIFYMGGLASRYTLENRWFNNKVEEIRANHGINNWDVMKTTLERTMWSPLHDESGRNLLDDLITNSLLGSLSKA